MAMILGSFDNKLLAHVILGGAPRSFLIIPTLVGASGLIVIVLIYTISVEAGTILDSAN
ncbi:hypothetical protein [Psychrobacter frigidicola]|uniref:hypothetical protein n=1 Tax=Psychrobacter frigidicola TaxID=45611 RepID=UPI001D121770|nr:hypothetical protein [Psychrobacter frigidicola]